jgi:predicted transcriptional regulator
VPTDTGLEAVMTLFGANQAVIVVDADRVVGILTKIDLIDYLAAHMK